MKISLLLICISIIIGLFSRRIDKVAQSSKELKVLFIVLTVSMAIFVVVILSKLLLNE